MKPDDITFISLVLIIAWLFWLSVKQAKIINKYSSEIFKLTKQLYTLGICKVEGCGKPVYNEYSGNCRKHDIKARKRFNKLVEPKACKIVGCENPMFEAMSGLCQMHYAREKNTGMDAHIGKF